MNPESVCLIIPPSPFLLDERVFMSLGILRVAAVLEKEGVKVHMLDLSGVENYLETVKDYVDQNPTDVFGITATTPQLPNSTEVRDVIKKNKPGAKVILGGPHPTLVAAAWKRELKLGLKGRGTSAMQTLQSLFDVVVAGDGEEAIFPALEEDAPSFVDADDPKSSLFLTNSRLNELPWPARHLVDVESYRYSIEGEGALSLIAQLGCPFACGFCGGRESPMLRRVRMRSSENVVAEMVHVYKTTGRKGFMLYDDELNVNPKILELMEGISRAQKDLGVEWRLRGFIKAQLFTDEQAEAMRQAGFRWILTGFESGSPRILENINKRATREENTRCVTIAKRHGLKVKALMSIGHPGETEETIQETLDWLLTVKPEELDVTIITCYPGTPYYDYALPHSTLKGVWTYTFEKTGDQLHQVEVDYTKVADYYKGDPDGGYKAYVFTNTLTSEELIAHRDRLERVVREKLGIPFNPGAPAIRYEHSMGQGGLPPNILRKSS
jgi:anaerobic magnesium-protoporphyrin IX monomethyl ester cyclase